MKLFIAPYNMGSESAKVLAQGLNALRINGDKSLPTCAVINWGRSNLSLKGKPVKVFNHPYSVAMAANKIATFKRLTIWKVPHVEWTQDANVAKSWLSDSFVYARTIVDSSQGEGIVIVGQDDIHFPSASLYTKGFNNTHEYRVHVAFDEVIDFTKKKKRLDAEVNPLIKNSSNGWVFCREEIELPEKVKQVCVRAVKALGLDFGAVDVLYKQRDNEAKICEVNTAPGIEGTTLTAYINKFNEVLNG